MTNLPPHLATKPTDDASAAAMAVRMEHITEWIGGTVNMRIEGDLLAILKDGQVLCKLANSLNASIHINKLKTTFHCKENITAFLQWVHRMEVPEQDIFAADDLLWGNDLSIILRTLSALYNMFAEEIRASIRYTQSEASYRSNSVVSDGWSSDDSGLGDLHDDSADEDHADIAESIFVRENRSSSKFAAFMLVPPVVISAPPSRKKSVESNMNESVETRATNSSVVDTAPSPMHHHMTKPKGPPKTFARSPTIREPPVKATSSPIATPALMSADPRTNLANLIMQTVPLRVSPAEDDDDEMMTPPSSPKVHIPLQTPKSSHVIPHQVAP
ncbi:hypothetical protein AaE_013433, partial [Aphanomyces astaci]